MVATQSSVVRDWAYNATAAELTVWLGPRGSPGVPYVYTGVPAAVPEALARLVVTGGSLGAFYATHVKGRYPVAGLPLPDNVRQLGAARPKALDASVSFAETARANAARAARHAQDRLTANKGVLRSYRIRTEKGRP